MTGTARSLWASIGPMLMPMNVDVGVLERRPRGGDEVAHPGPDADHDVGIVGQPVGGQPAVRPGRSGVHRVVPGQRALAGLGLDDRDAEPGRERVELVGRLGVDRPAARDDDRAPGGRDEAGRVGDVGGLGRAAGGPARRGARRTARASRTPRTGRPRAARSSPPPVSTGSVRTRNASGSEPRSCSGREIRSKKRDTGRNASLALASRSTGARSAGAPDPDRLAK